MSVHPDFQDTPSIIAEGVRVFTACCDASEESNIGGATYVVAMDASNGQKLLGRDFNRSRRANLGENLGAVLPVDQSKSAGFQQEILGLASERSIENTWI